MDHAQSLYDERSDLLETLRKDIEEQDKKLERAERVRLLGLDPP